MSIKIASMNFGDCDTILHNTPNGMKNIAEVLGPNGEVYWSAIKELTGIPPLSFTADGTPLLDYLISGNTIQNGTPTPSNPVDVNGVGERTENLAPTISEDSGWRVGYLTNQGIYTNNNPRGEILSPMISLSGIGTFTISASKYSAPSMSVYYFNGATFISSQGATDYGGSAFDNFPSDATHFCFAICTGYQTIDSVVNHGWRVMLNTGSTAKPFEPYGYKIPISSGGVTTNIYLGGTQTVRQIYKFVLTGNEVYTYESEYSRFGFPARNMKFEGIRATPLLCTHYDVIDDGRPIKNVPNNAIYAGGSVSSPALYIKTDAYTTETDLKAYLAQQYANDTPVTVWYVLANLETAAVNEPLMKIGDYADTVNYEQAGVQIPTLHGQTVIDVETTLKPSEMYIKYK